MHLEHLSKSQIVLLTLLVSFVTSIATGIVTISLMEQAPPTVAQTVNRVIERTVEKIVPAGQTASTVVTREKTVVVKESDLISAAVERVVPAMVRLYDGNKPEDAASEFLGLGLVVDTSGTIMSDEAALGERTEAEIAGADGSLSRVFVTSRDKSSGTVMLHAGTTTPENAPELKSAAIGSDRPVLGQTVIALSGKSLTRIADGIITALVPSGNSAASGLIIETSVSRDVIIPGAILLNTDGQVIGISTGVSREKDPSGFIAASMMLTAATSLK